MENLEFGGEFFGTKHSHGGMGNCMLSIAVRWPGGYRPAPIWLCLTGSLALDAADGGRPRMVCTADQD